MVDLKSYKGNWVVYHFNTLRIAQGGMTITKSNSDLPYNIIIPEDGIYLAEFNGVGKSENMVTGTILAGIKSSQNDNNYAIGPFVAGQGLMTVEVSSVFKLNKDDSLGVYLYTGGYDITMNPSNVGYYTKFSVIKIGN